MRTIPGHTQQQTVSQRLDDLREDGTSIVTFGCV